LKFFHSQLKPALDARGVVYETLITRYAGHAREAARSRDLSRYSGMAAVSGDGTVNEIYAGIRDRGHDPSSVAVGVLPGGSGCALCCSLLYSLGQPLEGPEAGHMGAKAAVRNVVEGAATNTTVALDILVSDIVYNLTLTGCSVGN